MGFGRIPKTRLFIANEGSNNLLVLDSGTNEVIATIRLVANRSALWCHAKYWGIG